MSRANNPNQKTVKITKQKCDNKNIYAKINIEAMNSAAIDLKAGAFKLWVYLAKNAEGYEFGLSNADAKESFGIKKDQYDGAVKELIEKGYLVEEGKSYYVFYENPVVGKNHNDVVVKTNNDVVGKNHNEKQEKTTRNITDITSNRTVDTVAVLAEANPTSEEIDYKKYYTKNPSNSKEEFKF